MIKRYPSKVQSKNLTVTSDALKEVPVRGTPNGEVYVRPIDESLTEEGYPTKGKKGRPLLGNANGTLKVINVTPEGNVQIELPPGPIPIIFTKPPRVVADIGRPLDISSIPPVKVANFPEEISVKPHSPNQYKIRPIDVALTSDQFLIIPGKTNIKEIHFQILDIWNRPTKELFSLQPSFTGVMRSDHFDVSFHDGYVKVTDLTVKFQYKLTLHIAGYYIES